MAKRKIDEFIRENREKFYEIEPPAAVWDSLEKQLPAKQVSLKTGRMANMSPSIKIAAAVLLVSIGGLIYATNLIHLLIPVHQSMPRESENVSNNKAVNTSIDKVPGSSGIPDTVTAPGPEAAPPVELKAASDLKGKDLQPDTTRNEADKYITWLKSYSKWRGTYESGFGYIPITRFDIGYPLVRKDGTAFNFDNNTQEPMYFINGRESSEEEARRVTKEQVERIYIVDNYHNLTKENNVVRFGNKIVLIIENNEVKPFGKSMVGEDGWLLMVRYGSLPLELSKIEMFSGKEQFLKNALIFINKK